MKKLCIVNASTVNRVRQILVVHGVKTYQCAVYFIRVLYIFVALIRAGLLGHCPSDIQKAKVHCFTKPNNRLFKDAYIWELSPKV